MNRKPYLLLPCAFALLCLMGAAAPVEQPEAARSEAETSISVQADQSVRDTEDVFELAPAEEQTQTEELADEADALSIPAEQPEPDPGSQVEPQTQIAALAEPEEAETLAQPEEAGDEQLYIDGKPAP